MAPISAKRKSASNQPLDASKSRASTNGSSATATAAPEVPDNAASPVAPSQIAEQAVAADGRAKIYNSTIHHEVNDRVVQVLSERSEVFTRGGHLVQVVEPSTATKDKKKQQQPQIRKHTLRSLTEETTRHAHFVSRTRKEGSAGEEQAEKFIHPPLWSMGEVLERGRYEGIRHLEGFTTHPLWLGNGSILTRHGYDADSGLYLCDQGEPPNVPKNPDRDDALEALNFILNFVSDFPFQNADHVAAWVAMLLTVFARFSYSGNTPFFLVDANLPGSGKGKLVNIPALIATGRRMPITPFSFDKAEMDKFLTAAVIAGTPWICFDNIVGEFGHPSLDAILTNPDWTCRKLGTNDLISEPFQAILFATGNNMRVKGDLGRRCLHIRLVSPVDNPETRTGFRYQDLEEAVRQNRKRLQAAIFTIFRAYDRDGRPPQKLIEWGSFGEWSLEVRSPLVWLGQPDPAKTLAPFKERGNAEREHWTALLGYWYQAQLTSYGMTTAEFISHVYYGKEGMLPGHCHAEVRELLELMMREVKPRALGNLIKGQVQVPYDGLWFVDRGKKNNMAMWAVEPVPNNVSPPSPTIQTMQTTGEGGRESSLHSLDSRGDLPFKSGLHADPYGIT